MTQTIVLCSLIVLLVMVNLYEKHKATKREQDLLNRLMSDTLGEYASTVKYLKEKPKKPEKEEPVNEDDITYPVD